MAAWPSMHRGLPCAVPVPGIFISSVGGKHFRFIVPTSLFILSFTSTFSRTCIRRKGNMGPVLASC